LADDGFFLLVGVESGFVLIDAYGDYHVVEHRQNACGIGRSCCRKKTGVPSAKSAHW
jgi:hypothetical protein